MDGPWWPTKANTIYSIRDVCHDFCWDVFQKKTLHQPQAATLHLSLGGGTVFGYWPFREQSLLPEGRKRRTVTVATSPTTISASSSVAMVACSGKPNGVRRGWRYRSKELFLFYMVYHRWSAKCISTTCFLLLYMYTICLLRNKTFFPCADAMTDSHNPKLQLEFDTLTNLCPTHPQLLMDSGWWLIKNYAIEMVHGHRVANTSLFQTLHTWQPTTGHGPTCIYVPSWTKPYRLTQEIRVVFLVFNNFFRRLDTAFANKLAQGFHI